MLGVLFLWTEQSGGVRCWRSGRWSGKISRSSLSLSADTSARAVSGTGAVRVTASQNPPETRTEEDSWVRRAQKGDRQAFADLVEAYWDRLYRWLYQLTHDRHAAEDLAQDAFLKALANLKRFRAGSNFGAWLFRIAHNAFVNQCRSPSRRREPMPDDLPGRNGGPVDEVVSREALQTVARALGRLAIEFRAALLLRVEEGLSFKQIADVLELTEETARWRVFKARQKLLELLTPRQELEKP
jgi:RNA polymerase sigma-70 factor (ECF subfamily)